LTFRISFPEKVITRGRTDHFAAGVTYLQFPNSGLLFHHVSGETGFSSFTVLAEKGTFSSGELEL